MNQDLIASESAPSCPVCGTDGRVIYEKLRDRLYSAPGFWSMRGCPNCSTHWLDPRPAKKDIPKLYKDYFTHDEAADLANNTGLTLTRGMCGILRKVLLAGKGRESQLFENRFLERRPGERLLDVGCGDGAFLARMQRDGWEVVGTELDQKAAEVARSRFGVRVVDGDLDTTSFEASSFDAITLSHVIEHVHDPGGTLRRCFTLLRPGGRLAITTPNINSVGHKIFKRAWFPLEPPRHLILFAPRVLGELANRAGFRVRFLGTSDRTASGLFILSSRIRKYGAANLTLTQTDGGVFERLLRMGYVLGQRWGKFIFGEIGEEIGLLAVKV